MDPDQSARWTKLADDELDGPIRPLPGPPLPINTLYWTLTAGATCLVFLIMSAANRPEGLWAGLFMVALGLPAIQLGVSLLAALILACVPGLRREPAAWKRLGWITLGSVIGCILGIVIMYVIVARR
jgi:hypothetical protein